MDRRCFNRLLGSAALGPALLPGALVASTGSPRVTSASGLPPTGPRRWSFVAEIAECCSCAIPCPCNFGRPVETCFGNRLIQVRAGEWDGMELAGIRFLVSFHMGQWTRIYADAGMSPAEAAAFEAFLPVGFAGFRNLARAVESAPLEVVDGGDAFRFAVPDSEVEMRLLAGLGGEPIRIQGLPSPVFHDYVQFESVVHRHRSSDGEWSYSGTNGFRSEMRASG